MPGFQARAEHRASLRPYDLLGLRLCGGAGAVHVCELRANRESCTRFISKKQIAFGVRIFRAGPFASPSPWQWIPTTAADRAAVSVVDPDRAVPAQASA